MQIAHITLHPIATRRRTGIANQHVVVQVETDNGYVGWGEMSDLSHVPMYQFDLPELERMLNELCRGRDPRNLSALEDALIKFFPDEGHMYSRSGLVRQGMDLALHDLLGRRDGVPVYELLGGALGRCGRACGSAIPSFACGPSRKWNPTCSGSKPCRRKASTSSACT